MVAIFFRSGRGGKEREGGRRGRGGKEREGEGGEGGEGRGGKERGEEGMRNEKKGD